MIASYPLGAAWHAFRTEIKAEVKAKAEIEKLGYETFVPWALDDGTEYQVRVGVDAYYPAKITSDPGTSDPAEGGDAEILDVVDDAGKSMPDLLAALLKDRAECERLCEEARDEGPPSYGDAP